MGWLQDALDELRGPQPIAPAIARPKPKPKADIKTVWVQTRQPIDSDDPGAAEPGFYSVSDGVVTMHDETGKPTGKEYELRPGDDARRIAQRLTREAWLRNAGTSDFNRPLNYRPLGIA